MRALSADPRANFVSQLNGAPSQKRRACVSERAARYKGEFPGKLIASGVRISSHLSPSVRTPTAICFGAYFPLCVNATQKRTKLIANYFLIRVMMLIAANLFQLLMNC
jgi:hypothetical protein